jgi:ABC-2 type transport system permease protein
MGQTAAYFRVFLTFARNSLVRDMTFRGNFIADAVTSMAWMFLNLTFYLLVFRYTNSIGKDTGWGQYQFFLFFATGLLINSVVQAFFMTNVDELTDLIRTGGLDFLLLKPIDTQFLVSLRRIEWSSLSNLVLGLVLLGYSLVHLDYMPGPIQVVLYLVYVICGIAIYYSLMITLGASTVWMGRNLTLYDFWFYIITFSRYPMEIYTGRLGQPLGLFFTFVIPVLLVVNVPARMLVWPLAEQRWWLAAFAVLAAAASVAASRWVFQCALSSYRSASS